MSSRLTGATNKTEAMLDQQPKTNQVKQQPAAPQAVGHGCWQRPKAAHRNTHAHTPGTCFYALAQVCLGLKL